MLNKPARVVCALLGLVAAASLSGAPACGAETAVPTVDCKKTPPKKYSELTIIPKCINCHSSARTAFAASQFPGTNGWAVDPHDPSGLLPDPTDPVNQVDGGRHGAYVSADFDTYGVTRSWAFAAEADIAGDGLCAQSLDGSFSCTRVPLVGIAGGHVMPPVVSPWRVDGWRIPPEPTDAERMDFYAWVQCGMPN